MRNLYPASQHYLIGLTGNIGSGKSLVRKMLEHLGVLGVDADWLTRQAALRGGPAFEPILARFGQVLLNEKGEIDRQQLGRMVFSDPQALADLEEILHPYASIATRKLLAQSPLPVVVVEAIKLLESDLAEQCQSIWVVEADENSLFERLARSRGMSKGDARQRLAQQTPAAQMKKRAEVVIDNSGSAADTWRQVQSAYQALPTPDWDRKPLQASQKQVHLLAPDVSSLTQVQEFLLSHPNSLPAQFLAWQQANGVSLIDSSDALLRAMLRFSFNTSNADQADELAVWEREGFACCLGGYAFNSGEDEKRLETLIKGIEGLNTFYLCNQMSLPAPAAFASSLARLGYEISKEPQAWPEFYQKAGYNLYRNTNTVPLDLF
jgi:dephospho-CoA kinase